MKPLLFYLLLFAGMVFISPAAKSQTSLEFNQVVFITDSIIDSGCPQETAGTVYTVPAGKAWKIEQFFPDTWSAYFYVEFNGHRFHGTALRDLDFPIWMKAGDQIRAIYNYQGGSPCGSALNQVDFLISILEFNLTP